MARFKSKDILLVGLKGEKGDPGSGGSGTTVTVGGVEQTTWDADTKLDKVTEKTQFHQLYGKMSTGEQKMYNVSHYNYVNNVPVFESVKQAEVGKVDNGGTIAVSIPLQPYQATPRTYVDTGLDGKVDKVTDKQRLYGTNAIGEPFNWQFGSEAIAYTVMYRNGYGTASIADPVNPLDITNKKWVEDNFTVYKHLVSVNDTESGFYFGDCYIYSTQSTVFESGTDLPSGMYPFGSDNSNGIMTVGESGIINLTYFYREDRFEYYSVNLIPEEISITDIVI